MLRWYLRLLAGLTLISFLGQLALPAQLAQLPLEHVQLCPPLETTVPMTYERQLLCA